MLCRKHSQNRHIIILGAVIFALSGCQTNLSDKTRTPFVDTDYAQRHMISSAHKLASEAGLKILRNGGSAVDAAISAQLVLSLVEPQSSGIGGGGFLLHFDSKSGAIESYDGRETAPQSAHMRMFLKRNGKPKHFLEAVVGGSAVGVPGLVRMLEMAHLEHGRLPWADLFSPAIQLSEKGFPLSPRLSKLLAREQHLRKTPAAVGYLYNYQRVEKPEGTILKNPAFAITLRRIAYGGANAFYRGPIAESIVYAIRHAKKNPGNMTLSDLANYKAIKRTPVCNKYRTKLVCGMGPPSSGGLTISQMLGLLSRFDLQSMRPNSIGAIHLISEAGALAFADRNTYIGDSDFVSVPVKGLINTEYLKSRAALIDPQRAGGRRKSGDLKNMEGSFFVSDDSNEGNSTTHLSVIDGQGNAVSMTSSIESAFGSRQMASGFLLNNQLTDFSFQPDRHGQPVANRVTAGKRPRSSMSPTLVFNEDNSLMLVLGSPGGSRIIGFVAKVLVGVIDWKLSMQDAIDLPNFLSRNNGLEIEKGSFLESLAPQLKDQGHRIKTFTLPSGLQGIRRTPKGLEGGADKRREGVFLGD